MPMVVYYLTATGEVIDGFSWPDTATPTDYATLVPAGGAYIVIDDTNPDSDIHSDLHYIVSGVKTDRPFIADDEYQINNDGTETVTIALPSGTVIDYDYYLLNQQTSAAENWVFTSVLVGTFVINFDPPFPYQDQVVRIYVNDNNG